VKQISSPVLWRAAIENMIRDGVDTFIEAGPGKTLSGLVSRISDKARTLSAEDTGSLKKAIDTLTG